MSLTGGGPTAVVREMAQSARRAGIYQAEVVCLDAPDQPILNCEGMAVHCVGPGLGKYGFTPRLDRWLKENLSRFDGVVVNGLWQYHGHAVWKQCRGTTPYVVFPHGMLDPWFKKAYPLKHVRKALYWSAIERRLLRDALRVMFTSPTEAELASQTFPHSEWKSCVVPYGTVAPAGKPELQIEQFYAVCPEVRDRNFILFIGRLHKKKGCDLLVQAFAHLYRDHPEIHLVIAGPDEEKLKPELTSLATASGIGDRVHFPGMLTGDAKWGAFYAAEVFALPSHQENFGVAVAEALARGTPVLISNEVNIWREIVADGVGLVDEDDLAGTIRLLTRWRALTLGERAEMARKCQATFQRRYDLSELPRMLAGLLTRSRQSELVPSES